MTKPKIRATMSGAFALEFQHDTSIRGTLGPDGLKTKIHTALMGDNVEEGPRRAIVTLGEWWKDGLVTLVFYEQDRVDVLDRLHPLGIVPKAIKHGEKVTALAERIAQMMEPPPSRKTIREIADFLATNIGEDDVAELRGDRLEAAANVLDCNMGGMAVAEAAEKLRREWADLNAQVLDVRASIAAEGIDGAIGDGVQMLRERVANAEQLAEDWNRVALRLLALALVARAQWVHLFDLWTRASSEVAAMRMALEAEESAADDVLLSQQDRDVRRRQATALRRTILSTSRPFMSAVPLSWVRYVLTHGYPGVTGDMVNDVIRDLERAMVDGGPAAGRVVTLIHSREQDTAAPICPDCHHLGHAAQKCGALISAPDSSQQVCPCETGVAL